MYIIDQWFGGYFYQKYQYSNRKYSCFNILTRNSQYLVFKFQVDSVLNETQ